MAKSSVIDRDLGWQDIQKELKKLSGIGVKVGIIEGTGANDDGVDIAEYGYYNEVGTKDGHIPSRPFIRSWVDNNQEQINKVMDSAYRHVVSGKWNAEDAMKRIGESGERGIKKNIKEGDFIPNSPATVKRKKGSKPLIDSGTLRRSIRYQVVRK